MLCPLDSLCKREGTWVPLSCLSSLTSPQMELSTALCCGGRRGLLNGGESGLSLGVLTAQAKLVHSSARFCLTPGRTSYCPHDPSPNPWHQEGFLTASAQLN